MTQRGQTPQFGAIEGHVCMNLPYMPLRFPLAGSVKPEEEGGGGGAQQGEKWISAAYTSS